MDSKIKKIKLTGTDIEVTPVGLGLWQFAGGHGLNKFIWTNEIPEAERIGIVKAAIDGGINWFDTAEAYGGGRSERNLANALKSLSIKNEEVIIADKWMPLGRFAGNLKKNINKRLKYLGGYSIGIFQIHQPWSLSTIKAQMNAMADLVENGKIRAVGVSNFSRKKMIKAYDALEERNIQLVTNQVQYNLLHRDIEKNGILDTAKELGIKIICWGPLNQGVLAGKYHKDPSLMKNVSFVRRRIHPNLKKQIKRTKSLMNAIEEIAISHEVTATQVALNWLINFNENDVLVIPGASKIHHVEQNIGAMHFKLSNDELAKLDELSRPFSKIK